MGRFDAMTFLTHGSYDRLCTVKGEKMTNLLLLALVCRHNTTSAADVAGYFCLFVCLFGWGFCCCCCCFFFFVFFVLFCFGLVFLLFVGVFVSVCFGFITHGWEMFRISHFSGHRSTKTTTVMVILTRSNRIISKNGI